LALTQDRVADVLTKGLAATLGATVLAIPWYGFVPLASPLYVIQIPTGFVA